MSHCFVKEAENILDKEFKVLNRGFIRLVDYMGSDERIVQAARVSYGAGTKTVREDAALIDYLLKNEHTSPFEQVVMTFHIKLPIFVARQWVRHRTARINEVSGRYSVLSNECYIPLGSDIAEQSEDNKQGRKNESVSVKKQQEIIAGMKEQQKSAFDFYGKLLDKNIAREIARINLPLSTYTEWYWQIDLHNLFRFLKLRLNPHAQKEIREYAVILLDICKRIVPIAAASFENRILNGISLSNEEIEAVNNMLDGKAAGLCEKDLCELQKKLRHNIKIDKSGIGMSKNEVFNTDCMEHMKECKDKEFDLAIVDPSYGIQEITGRKATDGGVICILNTRTYI